MPVPRIMGPISMVKGKVMWLVFIYNNHNNHNHNYHHHYDDHNHNNNRNYNKETVIRKKWATLQNIPDISTTNAVNNNNTPANFRPKEQKKIPAGAKWSIGGRGGGKKRDNVREAAAATADSPREGG